MFRMQWIRLGGELARRISSGSVHDAALSWRLKHVVLSRGLLSFFLRLSWRTALCFLLSPALTVDEGEFCIRERNVLS